MNNNDRFTGLKTGAIYKTTTPLIAWPESELNDPRKPRRSAVPPGANIHTGDLVVYLGPYKDMFDCWKILTADGLVLCLALSLGSLRTCLTQPSTHEKPFDIIP